MQKLVPLFMTFLVAGLPFTELRGSIPLSLAVWRLSVWQAFLASVLGNAVIPLGFALLLQYLARLWKDESRWERMKEWLAQKFQKKLMGKETWEGLALAIFVAVPLPGTGAWTAVILAFLLGLPVRKSYPFIALGVFMAGILVTLISIGVFGSLRFLLK